MATDSCPASTSASELLSDITGRQTALQAVADTARESMEDFSSALVSTLAGYSPTYLTIDSNPPVDLDYFVVPTAPTTPAFEYAFDVTPYPAGVGEVGDPELATAPEFTAAEPKINIVTPPEISIDPFSIPEPDLDTITVPSPPTLISPPNAALMGIPTIGDPDFSGLPTFIDVAPDASDVAIPTGSFEFNPDEYTQEFFDELTTTIKGVLNGDGSGVGLSVAVWNQIVDQSRMTLQASARAAKQEAANEWAAKGFALPGGALMARINRITQSTLDKESELSRSIFVEHEKHKIEQLNHYVAQAISYEQVLSDIHYKYLGILLDASKYNYDAALRIFEAKVSLFNASLQAYQVKAEVWRSRLEAGIQQVTTQLQAEIERAKATGELNAQKVQIMLGQYEGLKVEAELYNSQVKGAVAQIEAEKTKVESYRAQAEAYMAKVKGVEATYSAYETYNRSEATKASIFGEQAQAFSSRVQAYATLQGAKNEITRTQIENNRLKLQGYQQTIERLRLELQRMQAQADIDMKAFMGEVSLFDSKAKIAEAAARHNVASAQVVATDAIERTKTNLAMGQINLQHAAQLQQLSVQANETAMQVYSALAGSAYAALNIGSSISAQDSTSQSCQTSYSHNWNYQQSATTTETS